MHHDQNADQIVKMYANPSVIIISLRVDESVDEHLDPEHVNRGSVNGNGPIPRVRHDPQLTQACKR